MLPGRSSTEPLARNLESSMRGTSIDAKRYQLDVALRHSSAINPWLVCRVDSG